MHISLRKIPLERVCTLDIETVVEDPNFSQKSPKFERFRKRFRDKVTDKLPTIKDTIALYFKHAPMLTGYNKIVCISLGAFQGDEIVTTSFFGDEKEILSNFVQTVETNDFLLFGHNIIGFDIPVIRQRYHYLKLQYEGNYLSTKKGNDVRAKPWDLEEQIFDTMLLWKGTKFDNTSLGELLEESGLASSKDDIDGSEVTKTWYSGEEGENRVIKYCEKDTGAINNLLLFWRGEEPRPIVSYTFDTIRDPYTGEESKLEGDRFVDEEEEPQKPQYLEDLSIIDEITDRFAKGLAKELGPVDKEDVELIEELLLARYFRNFPENKAGKERRISEIKEFITNNLIVNE